METTTTETVMQEKPALQMSGADGNAMMIIGRARIALRQAGYTKAEIDRFSEDAMKGDYDNLLRVCMEWFNVS